MTGPPDLLAALLATLLPGDATWPAGDTIAAQVRHDLAAEPETAAALDALLTALPPAFQRGDEAALHAAAAADPDGFDRVVALAYIAYYTDPEVRRVIEHVTGYEARPPQPLGYALPPFDDALLEVQRRRAPFWRNPDGAGP